MQGAATKQAGQKLGFVEDRPAGREQILNPALRHEGSISLHKLQKRFVGVENASVPCGENNSRGCLIDQVPTLLWVYVAVCTLNGLRNLRSSLMTSFGVLRCGQCPVASITTNWLFGRHL